MVLSNVGITAVFNVARRGSAEMDERAGKETYLENLSGEWEAG